MNHPNPTAEILPLPVPTGQIERVTLFGVRRMAAHGLRDAHAANTMLALFGLGYRRPLVLLRAFMLELARSSSRAIMIAPCCALRMTSDEGRILAVLATATTDTGTAVHHLNRLAGHTEMMPALSAAMAYKDALADMGRPIGI